MTFDIQIRNTVFNIKPVAFVVDLVIFGEDGRKSCPDALELLTGIFLGFVFVVIGCTDSKLSRANRDISISLRSTNLAQGDWITPRNL